VATGLDGERFWDLVIDALSRLGDPKAQSSTFVQSRDGGSTAHSGPATPSRSQVRAKSAEPAFGHDHYHASHHLA
jgi:hypothetical protein